MLLSVSKEIHYLIGDGLPVKDVEIGSPELVKVIRERIHSSFGHAIPFREYMNLCLYQEPYGYYRNSSAKIGKKGDFYTSSSVGTIMGEMLAAYVIKQWKAHTSTSITIVEWGGGNGRLALHLLDALQQEAVQCYSGMTYTMIESSEYHRSLQKSIMQPHENKVIYKTEEQWLSESSESEETVIVLANELLDAFPVHRIRYADGLLQECYVSWNEEEQHFSERWLPLENDDVIRYADKHIAGWKEGQMAEINLDGDQWIRSVANRIGAGGQLVIIDYGDNAEELYAPHRLRGTLMCYRKHQASDNPYIYQGLQDITAHVNFSSCIHAGLAAGFGSYELGTQRQFLVNQGILEKLQEHYDPNPFSDQARRNRSIRQLLISDQMSELFKVLILKEKR